MADKQYEWLKRNHTFSKPVGLTKMRAAAALRLIVKRGPFGGTRNGVMIWHNKSRLVSLRKLARKADEGRIGDVYRVRRGDGATVFTTRAVRAAPRVDPRRLDMVKYARWMISHEGAMHYSQARPIPRYSYGHLPMSLDCSGSTITLARWAGLPDPSGSGFNGSGNTDTILAHARSINRSELQVGDMVLWAYGSNGQHIAVVIETGDDPLLESHGMEAGPLAIRLSAEDRYHSSATLHYLSIT
jgi:hypothetical protein